jgi:hypothetical protein
LDTIFALFVEAGPLRWVFAGAGFAGAAVGLMAQAALAVRARWALVLGAVAVGTGAAVAVGGGAAVLHGRVTTDAAVAELRRPVERQRARRDGYLAAQPAGRFGLACAALPITLGLAATLFASRRRRGADPEAPPTRPGLALPAGMTLSALLGCGFAVAALHDPVPARNLQADETKRRVLVHLDRFRSAPAAFMLDSLCEDLEEEIVARHDSFDPAQLPALSQAAHLCIEHHVQVAAVKGSLVAVVRDLEAIQRSPLVEHDPDLRLLVERDLGEVRDMARAARAEPSPTLPVVRLETVEVTGGLSHAAVWRVLRRNEEAFLACQEDALRLAPTLKGRVRLRFNVDARGRARDVSGDGPAAGVVACITSAVLVPAYPAASATTASVEVAMNIAAADPDPLMR